MANYKTYRLFQFLIMGYLMSAFCWWTILLFQKNKENFQLKTEILKFNNSDKIPTLTKEYKRSQLMIIGEGLVFAISILVSLVLINRAFWAELKTNNKLNNFLLSVTHELKTPISSLKLINRTIAIKNIPEDKKIELLNIAHDESLRLESLVNNILTAAQMDNNYHFNFESISLNEILENRVKRFKKLYPDFEIKFTQTEKGLSINADKESIIKLCDNLIDNAIKYSAGSKEISILTDKTDSKVVLKVIDQGIGIADSEKKRIFEKFYRIGNENLRSTKGTGLGLFIVNEICKAHRASLSILDNSPRGSIFKISFPSNT